LKGEGFMSDTLMTVLSYIQLLMNIGIVVAIIIILYKVIKHFSNQLKAINKTLTEIKEQGENNEKN
jgi:hypothetical protein